MVQRPVRIVPCPERVRRITGSFAWIDHRLLRNGCLARLTLEDVAVYVFLVLAADREGVSFYRKERICAALAISWNQFETARSRLVESGLIAFQPYQAGDVNGCYQVLPVPESDRA